MSISATLDNQTRKSQHLNTIAFCVDENYLPYATFVAMQIIRIDPYPIDVCICVPSLNCVSEFLKNLPIRFIAIDIQGADSLATGHLSIATYYRLFLPELLKNDYEHIIYLDADVYIRKPFLADIFAIISTYSSPFSVAAAAYMGEVENITFPEKQNNKIKKYLSRYHQLDHLYRNAGVLVFNVENFVASNTQQKIFQTADDNADKLESHDQSALNLALLGNIAQLPLQFNWQLNDLSDSIINEIDPYIIHFVNVNKPWVTRIYYLEDYILEYEAFLSHYFKEINFCPLSSEDKRRSNPKYSGVKEYISFYWYKYKNTKKEDSLRNLYQKNKNKILDAVTKINKGAY
jgi:lipopolysaccharide biosynthesis glycosyltransferase